MLFLLMIANSWHVEAAPITNLTALRTNVAPSWVSGPSGRGTWSLLYSCLFTLLLCVYTAIHLNIPLPDESIFKFWLRKTKWVAIAILAPEIIVYISIEQWLLQSVAISLSENRQNRDFTRSLLIYYYK